MALPWAKLALLGAIGLVMGALSLVPVFPTAVEFVVWLVIALALWAPGISRWSPSTPLLAGIVIGLVAGLGTGGVQSIFQARFLEVWPEYDTGRSAAALAGYLIGFGMLAGAVTGLVSGLVAWGVTAWRARKTAVVV